jgi:hypothetical protein
MDVGIPSNTRHPQKVQLWPRHGKRDRQRIIKPRITVDDDRKRFRHASKWRCPLRQFSVVKGRPTNL